MAFIIIRLNELVEYFPRLKLFLNSRHFLDFWNKIDVKELDDCWEWNAKRVDRGYGRWRWRKKNINTASVAAYYFFVGNPVGFCVCHSCDNPPCCNPFHLWKGTNLDNNKDRDSKCRQACGERIANSRLTRSLVRKIRKRYKQGITQRSLAKRYGLHYMTVYYVIHKKTWREA